MWIFLHRISIVNKIRVKKWFCIYFFKYLFSYTTKMSQLISTKFNFLFFFEIHYSYMNSKEDDIFHFLFEVTLIHWMYCITHWIWMLNLSNNSIFMANRCVHRNCKEWRPWVRLNLPNLTKNGRRIHFIRMGVRCKVGSPKVYELVVLQTLVNESLHLY